MFPGAIARRYTKYLHYMVVFQSDTLCLSASIYKIPLLFLPHRSIYVDEQELFVRELPGKVKTASNISFLN